jgi:hypothetical protein
MPATNISEETEFQRRRSLPYVEAHRIGSKRTFEVQLSLGGKVIGNRLELIKRNKVVSVTFFLPTLDT